MQARVADLEEENEAMDRELQVAAGEIQKQVSFSQAQAGAASSTVHVMRSRAEAAEQALRVASTAAAEAPPAAAAATRGNGVVEPRLPKERAPGGQPSPLGRAGAPSSPWHTGRAGAGGGAISPVGTHLQESLAQRSQGAAASTPGSADRWAALRASIAQSQRSGGPSTTSSTPQSRRPQSNSAEPRRQPLASPGRSQSRPVPPAPSPADSPAGSIGSVSSQATKERWLRAKNKAVMMHSEDLAARLDRMKSVRESVLVKMAGISPKLVSMASPGDAPGGRLTAGR